MFQRVSVIQHSALLLLLLLVIATTAATSYASIYTDYSELCFQGSNGTSSQFVKDYTVLYDYLTGTGAHNFSESVTIGFLGAYGQAQVVLGALPLAVEAVNKNKR